MQKKLLEICNLHAEINGVKIINGFNLTINEGEIHAIMGPNGSGKSTLAKIIAGHPSYIITQGKIIFNDENITAVSPEIRSHMGIFLAFQYPMEISGVSNIDFLRLAYNEQQKHNNKPELDPLSFFDFISRKLNLIGMDSKFLTRNVNEGFSGGEKKRNEILQMALLDSKIKILDEIDSGLDIDALKTIANGINHLHNDKNAMILITHYQRLLDYITPDFVHIMIDGKIQYTGNATLAKELEDQGYNLLELRTI
uniref:Probable ATP-dependent transporter ycf16 n=1 Tax=Lympha mucosa TaxID=2045360 RepID=A0A6B9VS01_9FLOR|nr:iron-sulfur cluster formation ABC transporter ATP-binding subunit [Lympha mucosa]